MRSRAQELAAPAVAFDVLRHRRRRAPWRARPPARRAWRAWPRGRRVFGGGGIEGGGEGGHGTRSCGVRDRVESQCRVREGAGRGEGHSSNVTGTATTRLRSHSPSPFACGSNRAWARDALPQQPLHHEVQRPQVRQHMPGDRQLRGSRAAVAGTGRRSASRASHRPRRVRTAPTPPRSRPRPCPRSAPRPPAPAGTRRVGPHSAGAVGGSAGSGTGSRTRVCAARGGSDSRTPSGRTATCSHRRPRPRTPPRTRRTARPSGRRRDVEAGVAGRAPVRRRRRSPPAPRASGSGPARRAAAARSRISSVSRVGPVGAGQLPTDLGRRRLGRARRRPRSAPAPAPAFASMSSPVSTNTTSLRQPPMRLSPALRVGGGASPRTPVIRTRSGPSWSSRTVSSRAVTSGPAYRAPDVSYRSCAVTVPVSTTPPVPGCLVMTPLPSAWISARGKPGRRRSPAAKSVKKA